MSGAFHPRPIVITRGRAFRLALRVEGGDPVAPTDLTGYSFGAALKPGRRVSGELRPSGSTALTFDVTVEDAAAGLLAIEATVADTTDLTIDSGVWDCWWQAPDGEPMTLIYGVANVTDGVA